MKSEVSLGRRLPLLIAVFCTALSTLAFEVGLSRAFSVLLRYHFVFLAISLATCGLGLGGLLDYLAHGWVRRTLTLRIHLTLRAVLLALLYPFAIYMLFSTPLAAYLTSVWVVSGICILPFLAAGTLLSRIFAEHWQAGGTIYSADLIGASLGSFLVIGALQFWGATNVPFVCGLAALVAALALSLSREPGMGGGDPWIALLPFGLGCAMVFGLVANLADGFIGLPVLPLRADPNAKPLYQELGDPQEHAKVVYSQWNAFARTDVVEDDGPSGIRHPHDDYYIYTDGEVPTNILWFNGDLRPLADRLHSFIGFLPFTWFKPKDVLLIGPGGGLDILLAEAVGTRHITGVELNPSIPRIVRRYGNFDGHVYDLSNVKIHVDEGRSFVRRSRQHYDLIYMALTKTATTASSSLALDEGYVFTEEAFQDYLAHLRPGGKVALVFQEPALILRTYLTALEALQTTGLSRQQALHCLIICSLPPQVYEMGPYRHLLIVSKQPFTTAESKRLVKQAIAVGFVPGVFPGAYEPIPFNWLLQDKATTPQFVRAWNQWLFGKQFLNITPRTDDRPFVEDLTFHVPTQFKLLLGGALLLALLFSGVALAVQGKENRASTIGLPGAVAYFSLLGIGFMMIEICLTQKLILYLGYPVLTLSVILFSLLLGSGLGSLFSQRFPIEAAGKVAMVAAGSLVVYGLILQQGQHSLVAATLGWDIRLRSLITFCMLVPLGFGLGMPFPIGLRAIGTRASRFVPWMWGVNGLTSVVGSVGAMTMAKTWGFTATLYTGWGVYALVALLCLSGVALAPTQARPPVTNEMAEPAKSISEL